MTLLVLASATEIAQRAATRASQDRVPELLRRLVYATTDAPQYIDFPSGDAVQLDGWDGAVELDEDHAMIPRGLSVWEIGTGANPKKKADDDYAKRTAAPPNTARGTVAPQDTTFVFATPRRWSAKKKWATARRKEQVWRDVRVLDADDLEAWLQEAPATHVWFSRLVGVMPAGVDDLETTWTDFAEATTPATSTAFMLAGRRETSKELTTWLASGSGTLTVVAESMTDAIGFVGASVTTLPDDEREMVLSRTVIVSNADAFVQLSAAAAPLIQVVAYAAGNEVQRATRACSGSAETDL